jgi:Protein of unknown function (DUF3455)
MAAMIVRPPIPEDNSIMNLVNATVVTIAMSIPLSVFAKAHARDDLIVPPDVPADLRIVEEGNVPFLIGHATGTQDYACSPAGSGFAWVLFTPEATLFNDSGKQLITHYFSPNPDEPNADARVVADGAIRATWQHRDTSTVWANAVAPPSFDPNFVQPNSVAWLKLKVVGQEEGPNGGDTLTHTTFIQRVNTFGGLAPSTGCSVAADVGKKAFMPYTADYVFYFNPSAEESN